MRTTGLSLCHVSPHTYSGFSIPGHALAAAAAGCTPQVKTKGQRRINFEQFLNGLTLVAEKKVRPCGFGLMAEQGTTHTYVVLVSWQNKGRHIHMWFWSHGRTRDNTYICNFGLMAEREPYVCQHTKHALPPSGLGNDNFFVVLQNMLQNT
jgi:hypothetical protein